MLLYEVTNAVVQARRREHISSEQAERILTSFGGLGVALRPVTWQRIFPLALRFERSAYDAAYLALAEMTELPMVTGDRRLYNAVREHLDWVHLLGDYERI